MIAGIKSKQGEQEAKNIAASSNKATLDVADYLRIRQRSEAICAPLDVEDYGVQPMADASPPKWHLAHTSWFFETFLIKPYRPSTVAFHPTFEHLFNSYYNGVGQPFPRTERGNLSRLPSARSWLTVLCRRNGGRIIGGGQAASIATVLADTVELGLHHEQQHQELLLTDIKFNFGHNPLYPALSC